MLGVAPEERRLSAVVIARAEETFHHSWRIRPYRSLLKTLGFHHSEATMRNRLVYLMEGGSVGDAEDGRQLPLGVAGRQAVAGLWVPGPESLPVRLGVHAGPASVVAPSLRGLRS